MRFDRVLSAAWLGALASAACGALRGEPLVRLSEIAAGGALIFGSLLGAWNLAQPLSRRAHAVLCGIALAAVPLSLFGQILKKATHHRPLGAVTFAVGAVVVSLAAAVVAARWLSFCSRRSPKVRNLLTRALDVAAASAVLLLWFKLLGAPPTRSGALDAAIGLGAAGLALRWGALPLALSRIGGVAWLLTLVVGVVSTLGAQPAPSEAHDLLASAWRWLLEAPAPRTALPVWLERVHFSRVARLV
ncbi:MAG TPA: hypothetical protein VFQ61_16165 [Polyangiaceae bacterium]|nr:hypothetical protein [Polyangiaceae bacterium]